MKAKWVLVAMALCGLILSAGAGAGYCGQGGSGKQGTAGKQRAFFPGRSLTTTPLNVLVLSNSHADTAAQLMAAKIAGINFTALSVDTYTPTAQDFQGYDAVLLFEDGIFSNAPNVGNAVYAYQQGGGGVLLATFVEQDWSNNTKYSGMASGWGQLETVSPLVSDTQGCEYNGDSMGTVLVPNHPIMQGVTTLTVDPYRGGTQLSPVGTALALWSTPNFLGTADPLVAVNAPQTGGRVAFITAAPHHEYYGGISGDFYLLFGNALKWVAKQSAAPSLTVSPPSGEYVQTQKFDLVFMIKGANSPVVGGNITLDANSVTNDIVACARFGTLTAGGQTIRCPDIPVSILTPGLHNLDVSLTLQDGTPLNNSVQWNVNENQE